MTEGEKVVCRFNDGRILKGYLNNFKPEMPELQLNEDGTGQVSSIKVGDLKAIFFVRSFAGDHEYKEKKTYGVNRPKGNRAFIRFKDGESLVGFLDGDVPWKRGFFLSRHGTEMQGFYLLPVDGGANNIRVFVVASSINDVTVVP